MLSGTGGAAAAPGVAAWPAGRHRPAAPTAAMAGPADHTPVPKNPLFDRADLVVRATTGETANIPHLDALETWNGLHSASNFLHSSGVIHASSICHRADRHESPFPARRTKVPEPRHPSRAARLGAPVLYLPGFPGSVSTIATPRSAAARAGSPAHRAPARCTPSFLQVLQLLVADQLTGLAHIVVVCSP